MAGLEGESSSQSLPPGPPPIDMDLLNELLSQLVNAMLAPLEEEEKTLPPKCPLVELFSVCIRFDEELKGEVYGKIHVKDEAGSLVYFDKGEDDCVTICNNELLPLHVPKSCRPAISASAEVELLAELYIKVDEEEEFEIVEIDVDYDFTALRIQHLYDELMYHRVLFDGGSVTMYYAAVERAVEARVEITSQVLDGCPLDVYGSIVALYGVQITNESLPNTDEFYQVTLFKRQKGKDKSVMLGCGEIPLSRSMIVLNPEWRLSIKAHLHDNSENEILDGVYTFPGKLKDSSSGCIEGQGCCLDLKVAWFCKASA